MPAPSKPEILRAWTALWDPNGPFHLPAALRKKKRIGLSWFRPPDPIAFPSTGPIVVLNSTAFGIVTINLMQAAISDLRTISPTSLSAVELDEASGELSVGVGFSALKLAGDYEVRRGRASGDALKIASRSLTNHPLFAAADPDTNITLARSLQPRLAQTANGQSMLNSYYQHNDAYSSAFTNSVFLRNWHSWQTGGKTTADWAGLTATAAQPGSTSTVVVNSSDGSTYDDNYQLHAYHMQNLLVVTCNSQNNNDAADAASCFKVATTGSATSPQTVDNVFGLVASGTPPDPGNCANVADPEYIQAINTRNAPIHVAIAREEEDVRRGVIIREETIRPIQSGFRSYVEAPSLKLVGKVTEDEHGMPQIRFDTIEGSVQDVELALGVFPGKLQPELAAAVAQASFLKTVLALQVSKALATSGLPNYVGRLMSLALASGSRPIR